MCVKKKNLKLQEYSPPWSLETLPSLQKDIRMALGPPLGDGWVGRGWVIAAYSHIRISLPCLRDIRRVSTSLSDYAYPHTTSAVGCRSEHVDFQNRPLSPLGRGRLALLRRSQE